MKLIVEYLDKNNGWTAIPSPIVLHDHVTLTTRVFGDEGGPSPYTLWYETESGQTESGQKFKYTYLTCSKRRYFGGISSCLQNQLFEFYTNSTVNEIPCSTSKVKVKDHDYACLSIKEFSDCLADLEYVTDYKAVLAAGSYLENISNEVRIIAFKK